MTIMSNGREVSPQRALHEAWTAAGREDLLQRGPSGDLIEFAGVNYAADELEAAVGLTYEEVMRRRQEKAAVLVTNTLHAEYMDAADLPFTD